MFYHVEWSRLHVKFEYASNTCWHPRLGDLLRLSIASPGNDFRLGACEAPPSIISTYLGEDMTSYLLAYKSE